MMLSPILTKILGVASIALLCSSLWYYSQYKSELASNEVLQSNIVQLEQIIQTQKLTLDSLQKDQLKLTTSIENLTSNNSKLTEELTNKVSEINSLRTTISESSLNDPFGTSVIAEQMFNKTLQSMAGHKDE